MQKLIGRIAESQILEDAYASSKAELIAVYGRRRVGKTYLVQSVYGERIRFMFTGSNRVSLATQLDNFRAALQYSFQVETPLAKPVNWHEAFRLLIQLLEQKQPEGKQVIFLDEFPWLDQKKSEFLSAFDHFWNNWASRKSWMVVVICGSAASWMIQNIVRNKGGLHNRLTQRIRVLPFNLKEAALFLQNQRVMLSHFDIVQLYMVTGGVPHYLNAVKPGDSAAQAIDRLCFSKDGILTTEFKDLYPALFGKAVKHLQIVRALFENPSGLTRTELISVCNLKTGGTVSRVIDELVESGFVSEFTPFGKQLKHSFFKLTDEFSVFYLKFMEKNKSKGAGTWQMLSATQPVKIWSGFAFELICIKHIAEIKQALGISGVYTTESAWRYQSPKNEIEKGAQIDLLIDRQDNAINLCEMKFHRTPWVMTADDARDLERKRQVFIAKTGTKKNVFITLVTANGSQQNAHYLQVIQKEISIEAFFTP